MSRSRSNAERVTALIGFAAAGGTGVAYALLGGPAGDRSSLVRVGFRCRPLAALAGRDVAYAALTAVASDLLRRGASAIDFRLADAELAADLALRRAVPPALTLPYVVLRCTLNRLGEASVAAGEDRTIRDLTARARAEVSLNTAA